MPTHLTSNFDLRSQGSIGLTVYLNEAEEGVSLEELQVTAANVLIKWVEVASVATVAGAAVDH
jgi:hypothetical protein